MFYLTSSLDVPHHRSKRSDQPGHQEWQNESFSSPQDETIFSQEQGLPSDHGERCQCPRNYELYIW